MKKVRKPRGKKKTGYLSIDLCPHCHYPNCDPMFGFNPSPAQFKIMSRKKHGLCPACGHAKCKCKSKL